MFLLLSWGWPELYLFKQISFFFFLLTQMSKFLSNASYTRWLSVGFPPRFPLFAQVLILFYLCFPQVIQLQGDQRKNVSTFLIQVHPKWPLLISIVYDFYLWKGAYDCGLDWPQEQGLGLSIFCYESVNFGDWLYASKKKRKRNWFIKRRPFALTTEVCHFRSSGWDCEEGEHQAPRLLRRRLAAAAVAAVAALPIRLCGLPPNLEKEISWSLPSLKLWPLSVCGNRWLFHYNGPDGPCSTLHRRQ